MQIVSSELHEIFWQKIKKNIINLLSAGIAQRVLKVKEKFCDSFLSFSIITEAFLINTCNICGGRSNEYRYSPKYWDR